jgi:hypothetical protein
MIIYNTTYCVSDKVYGGFLKWIREKHIPGMLESGYFSSPRISKVIAEDVQDGTSISVQFEAPEIQAVSSWNDRFGDLYRMELASLFSEEVLYFATYLEVLE